MDTRDTILRLTFMALVGLALVTSALSRAQEPVTTSPFVVYFDEDSLITDSIRVDGVIYVALVDVVRRMALPYTDATAAATFTIRAPGGTLVASRNDRRVTIDRGSIELSGRVVREDGRWFVPPDFITVALYRVGGTAFRYRSGSARMIAADIAAPEIRMGADRTEDSTRLTVRAGASVNVRVQQDPDSNRVVLAFDRAPLDPIIETLDYGDAAIRSVTYDDADGRSKIIVETTPLVSSVRLVPTDENRGFFVDFVGDRTDSENRRPAPADSRSSAGAVRVVVVDPGHGGLDGGTEVQGRLEKEITLDLARGLRAALGRRLDTTVILTRDEDRQLNGKDRAAIANNNQADLMISLHVGYSADPTESGSSLFLAGPSRPAGESDGETDALFKPWFRAFEPHAPRSREVAERLQTSLAGAIPGWTFSIREAPISALISTGMPAVLIELGNANNPTTLQALTDVGFQERLLEAIVDAVARFGTSTGNF